MTQNNALSYPAHLHLNFFGSAFTALILDLVSKACSLAVWSQAILQFWYGYHQRLFMVNIGGHGGGNTLSGLREEKG